MARMIKDMWDAMRRDEMGRALLGVWGILTGVTILAGTVMLTTVDLGWAMTLLAVFLLVLFSIPTFLFYSLLSWWIVRGRREKTHRA